MGPSVLSVRSLGSAGSTETNRKGERARALRGCNPQMLTKNAIIFPFFFPWCLCTIGNDQSGCCRWQTLVNAMTRDESVPGRCPHLCAAAGHVPPLVCMATRAEC